MKSLIEVLKLAEKHLEQRGVQSARLSAERLMASVLGLERLELYLSFDRPLTEEELEAYRKLLRRRGSHEPLQYILGDTQFRKLTVELGPGVLVPRPETEMLVQLVLDHLDKMSGESAEKPVKVLDLCTGSGVVGLSMAAERTELWCVLADISWKALGWAVKNTSRADCSCREAVRFLCADLCEALRPGAFFDIVVSNPPYVAPEEMNGLPEEIKRYEPLEALNGGEPDGTAVIGRIVESSCKVMKQGALLALEIGESQRQSIGELFASQQGKYSPPVFHSDLAGRTRFVTAFKK
jgi:release factor glutamine methyltransferase